MDTPAGQRRYTRISGRYILAVALVIALSALGPIACATSDQTSEEPAGSSEPDTAEDTAADANVENVVATQESDGEWTFEVTVRHPDTGWNDYADGWDVVAPDGTVLKPDPGDRFTRPLLHPHENEQPFTRSVSDVPVPDGVETVAVRAHDSVDGWGGEEVTVHLDREEGPGFQVER